MMILHKAGIFQRGRVPVRRTVTKKSGKVHTQTYWVKPEDMLPGDKPIAQRKNAPPKVIDYDNATDRSTPDVVPYVSKILKYASDLKAPLKRVLQWQKNFYKDREVPTLQEKLDAAEQEMQYMLAREAEGEDIGREWYGESVQKMRETLMPHVPSLEKEKNWNTFITLLAITSNGAKPKDNLTIALKVYAAWRKTGEFHPYQPGEISEATGKPLGWSHRAGAIADGINKFKSLVEEFGSVEAAITWMKQRGPIRDIRTRGAGAVGDADDIVPHSVLFGDKVGRFFANLTGDPDEATIDRWAIRTFQRWSNAMRLEDKSKRQKFKEDVLSTAFSAEERKELLFIFDQLSQRFSLTMPQVQAVMWYFEKRFWESIGAQTGKEEDYLMASKTKAKDAAFWKAFPELKKGQTLFDTSPRSLEDMVVQMLKSGTMPTFEEWFRAIARISNTRSAA